MAHQAMVRLERFENLFHVFSRSPVYPGYSRTFGNVSMFKIKNIIGIG